MKDWKEYNKIDLEAQMANDVNRKDLVLLLLYFPGSSGEIAEPIDGRTRLMKLLFLLQSEFPVDKIVGSKKAYDFQAYHYGPFAKDVYSDLEFLENVDLVKAIHVGDANSIDQNEEEKLVEDTTIGIDTEETDLIFEQERYKLTERGIQFVQKKLLPSTPDDLLSTISGLKAQFASMQLTMLLRYVYTKYPNYAKNSKLKYLVPAE